MTHEDEKKQHGISKLQEQVHQFSLKINKKCNGSFEEKRGR